MQLGFLSDSLLGIPLWGWGAILLVGVGAAIFLPKWFGGHTTDQTSSNTGTGQAALDPNIDPQTGVPYSIEGAINPATGLPAYYGTGSSTGGMSGNGWGNVGMCPSWGCGPPPTHGPIGPVNPRPLPITTVGGGQQQVQTQAKVTQNPPPAVVQKSKPTSANGLIRATVPPSLWQQYNNLSVPMSYRLQQSQQ